MLPASTSNIAIWIAWAKRPQASAIASVRRKAGQRNSTCSLRS